MKVVHMKHLRRFLNGSVVVIAVFALCVVVLITPTGGDWDLVFCSVAMFAFIAYAIGIALGE